MADITVFGAGMLFVVPVDSSTNYSLNASSGYYRSANYQLSWTGANLAYNGTTYIATSGTYTSLDLKDGNGNELIQVSNIAYAVQPSDNGWAAIIGKLIAGNDNWSGTSANETFAYDLGNDSFDGKGGLDTLQVTAGKWSDFSINKSGSGYQLTFTTPGRVITGQTDMLTNVERIQFPDKIIALDLDGNAGQSYRLYQAAFNRTPDLAGLGYWIGQMDKGAENLVHVANGFVDSLEFKQLYGDHISDNAFITALYTNVLHRLPDQAGFDYWNGRISDGMGRPSILVSFSESTENIAQVIGQISHGIEYTPYG